MTFFLLGKLIIYKFSVSKACLNLKNLLLAGNHSSPEAGTLEAHEIKVVMHLELHGKLALVHYHTLLVICK